MRNGNTTVEVDMDKLVEHIISLFDTCLCHAKMADMRVKYSQKGYDIHNKMLSNDPESCTGSLNEVLGALVSAMNAKCDADTDFAALLAVINVLSERKLLNDVETVIESPKDLYGHMSWEDCIDDDMLDDMNQKPLLEGQDEYSETENIHCVDWDDFECELRDAYEIKGRQFIHKIYEELLRMRKPDVKSIAPDNYKKLVYMHKYASSILDKCFKIHTGSGNSSVADTE